MINPPNPPLPTTPQPRRRRDYTHHIVRALSVTTAAALLIMTLFLAVGKFHLNAVGREAVMAFVYCISIALPSTYLLTRISVLYTDKFPRLIHLIRAAAQLTTAIAGTLFADMILQLLGIVPAGDYWSEFRGSAPFSIVISLIFGLSISSYETMRYKFQAATLELRTRQVEQERAYKLLAEARLSSLESRIHPHFLFNTLNSISALIPSDPARAEDTVGKLASLLRFSLNAHHSGLVPLAQELKVVRDYLEIEKTRFGSRLRYRIEVPASLADVRVPPLALQSLVENSVKHVVSQRAEGAEIIVAGSRNGASVRLEVRDDGPGFSLDSITPEHGLGNLISRIELLLGPAGRLEVEHENGLTAVRLSLPA